MTAMTATTTVEPSEITRLLEKLGDTPDTIRAILRDLHITGIRSRAKSCPIANYLAAHLDQPPEAYSTFIVFDDGTLCRTPEPVSDFIEAFDNGFYQELQQ
jgi:hypothetical protein